MLIAPKRLKLRTSNLMCIFPGTVQICLLKIFRKGAWQGHVTSHKNAFKLLFCKNSLGGDMHSHECLLVKILINYKRIINNWRGIIDKQCRLFLPESACIITQRLGRVLQSNSIAVNKAKQCSNQSINQSINQWLKYQSSKKLLLGPLLLVFCCSNSRSMTPITWQAAVDDEEQRPQLQDIFEAAIDGNHV